MIFDLNSTTDDIIGNQKFDVCICGAGVAGITLALNLSSKLRVLLLEAGGFDFSAESQAIYEGETVGRDFYELTAGRLRYFGGTSNHWGGDCRPLDSYDFERKSYLRFSGWPITRSDLNPYLDQAESILDLPENMAWNKPVGFIEETINSSRDFVTANLGISAPTRFGQKYRDDIQQRANITCLINANVTELLLSEDLATLDHLEVRGYGGQVFQARAACFVLACGAIENARLLLNSNQQTPQGLGNQHDLVGRFFADHLFAQAGEVILEDNVVGRVEDSPFGDTFKGRLKQQICKFGWTREAAERYRGRRFCLSDTRHGFAPSQQFMEQDQLLNFGIRLALRAPGHEHETDGIIVLCSEQAPNPSSRVSLATAIDQFGMNKAKLDWQLSDIDLRTMQMAVFRFGEVFAELGLGRVRVRDWLLADPLEFTSGPGHHHMGTTRMAASPEYGVVDASQKIFGTDNLYVAGSSVFTTGGYANPTLTIVQMTLRLAEHINSRPLPKI